ncbi:MAG: hypothetical protein Fur0017_25660 [Anaerolineales bacterium]
MELACDGKGTALGVNQFNALFSDLCGYSALLNEVTDLSLPGKLPQNNIYVGGVNVMLLQNGEPVENVPDGGIVTLSFDIPDSLAGKTLAILFWDESTNAWVEMEAAMTDGKLTLTLEKLGSYVVVDKTSVGQVEPQPVASKDDVYTVVLNWLKSFFQTLSGG